MNRTELETKINAILGRNTNAYGTDLFKSTEELTDLFIELSNERCKEQKELCVNELNLALQEITSHDEQCGIVLNAPLPSLH